MAAIELRITFTGSFDVDSEWFDGLEPSGIASRVELDFADPETFTSFINRQDWTRETRVTVELVE